MAQTSTGSIAGTVVDTQGLPVADATVTLKSLDTGATFVGKTGSYGGYQFQRIDYGKYEITVSKDGFKSGVVSGVKLDAATEYSVVPVKLEVGARTETVVVEGGEELVQTTSAEVTGTVEKKQIDDLPILDRNPLNLLSLQAGVANSGPGGGATIETTINGQRASFSNLTLDGINIQDNFIRTGALDFSPNLPLLSQAQEFTVTEQNGDVEKSGSSSVSIVTPKGTNDWHGEGFWYYRSNSIGRANDWFNDASGIPVPRLLQNQGGGNIGGPIKKDKLFVYGYYELVRLKAQSPNNSNQVTLSPAIQAALTSATPTLPFTYQPFDANGNPVGSPITQNLLALPNHPAFTVDPATLAVIKRVPTASNNNRVGDGVNLLGFQFNARDNDTRDNAGARADYNLNSHNTISGVFSYNRNLVDRPDIDSTFDVVPLVINDDHVKFLSAAWRWNPNANFTNEARFGFNLQPAFFLTAQKFGSSIIDSAGFPFTGPDPNFLPQGRNTHTYSWQDNASLAHGNHTFKFGAQIQRTNIFETDSAGILPDLQLGFSQSNANAPVMTDFPAPANASISTADFNNAVALLATASGTLSNVAQTFNVTSQKSGFVNGAPDAHHVHQNNIAFYAADNWRFRKNLTFTYGLRWDYFSPVDDEQGLVLLPVIPPGQTAAQALRSNATVDFAGGPSKRGLYDSFYKGFSPNVGVAWDPSGNGKTAVRAGFSINFVNDEFFTAAQNAAVGNAGLTTSVLANPNGLPSGPTVSNPATITVPAFGPFPTTFADNAAKIGVAANAGYAITPHLKPPYVEQWNLTVQREIGQQTSVSVGYVGNHGVGLFRAVDVNQVIIGPNGFLADFNRARANGFLSLAAGGPFDPLFSGPGSQPLTVFPNICGPGAFGFLDALGFINNDVQNGFAGDLAHIYQEFGCGPTPGFFAPNDNIVGGDLLENASFSTYHAVVTEVRRRLNRGLYFQANYVFSKVLTDYGTGVNFDQDRFRPYLDNARPQLDRGRAPFDFNHLFKANFTYELPIGKGHHFSSNNKGLSLLLDGWQTSSIFTAQSGPPFSIVSRQPTLGRSGTRALDNTAVSTLSPTQVGNNVGVFVQNNGTVFVINPKLVSSDGTGAPASNGLSCVPAVPGGFCNPQPGQVGNLSVNAFTGPTYFDWDLAAQKDFPIYERLKLTFRAEAFNVLNHPVFAPPQDANGNYVLNINSTTFGQSNNTISVPRIMQLSLHVRF